MGGEREGRPHDLTATVMTCHRQQEKETLFFSERNDEVDKGGVLGSFVEDEGFAPSQRSRRTFLLQPELYEILLQHGGFIVHC